MQKLEDIIAQKRKAKESVVSGEQGIHSSEAQSKRTPLIGIDVSSIAESELPMWDKIISGIADYGARTVVFVSALQVDNFHKNKKLIVQEKNGHDIYEPLDIIVLPSNKPIDEAFKNVAVPVTFVKENDTCDYDPIAEKGNGFYFSRKNKWEIFATVVRAIETYKFPYDWKNLLREIYKSRN